jgi:hypothetical protein
MTTKRPLHSMLGLLFGCMEILFLILAATIFGLDLVIIALPKSTLTYFEPSLSPKKGIRKPCDAIIDHICMLA